MKRENTLSEKLAQANFQRIKIAIYRSENIIRDVLL